MGIMMNFAEWLAAKGFAAGAMAPGEYADQMAAYLVEVA